jgi:hypothetical protein
MKNLEIAQDKPDAAKVQCQGRFDRSGSSLALSSPLSLISSLQLDELELKLELDDHLEGSLLLLGWRGEPLAFVLDVANEDGDGLREGPAPAYIARWDEPQPSDQIDLKQWLRCVVEVSWKPSEKGEVTSRWDQASRPHLSASGLLCSGVFYVLLVPLFDRLRKMSYCDWTRPFSNFWITLWKIISHRAVESCRFSP